MNMEEDQVIAKKGSRDIKVKLADQVCHLKRVVMALGDSYDADQRSYIATEVSTHGFDNISPDQAIKRLTSDHRSKECQANLLTPLHDTSTGLQSALPASTNCMHHESNNQKDGPKADGLPPVETKVSDNKEAKTILLPFETSPTLEVPSRISAMSRPNSTDDFFGAIDNENRAQRRLNHNLWSSPDEHLSLSPLLWAHTVSQNAEPVSGPVLTSMETLTPIDSATDRTSAPSSFLSESQGSSESGETYSTDYSSVYSSDDLLKGVFREPTVAQFKRELVSRLLQNLCSTSRISELVKCLPVSNESTTSGSNTTSHRSSSRASKSLDSKPNARREGKKRKKDGNEDGNSDEENGHSQNGTEVNSNGQTRRKLGCPYYLRSSWKYNDSRACAGPGWDNARHVR